jgi:hypothetical protein
MNKAETEAIVEMAKKPIERNPVFRAKMKNGEVIFCEISKGEFDNSSVVELFDGESRAVNAKDIAKAEPVSQADLLKEIFRLKKLCAAQEREIDMLESQLSFHGALI